MNPARSNSELVGLARIFWMVLSPGLMVLLAISILNKSDGWTAPRDLLFLALLATVMAARWYEFRGGSPQTGTGEPATPAHLRKYLACTAVVGVGLWVIANLLGNYALAH